MGIVYDSQIAEYISTRLLFPSRHKLRAHLGSLDELAESIRKHGLIQPVVARPATDGFEVICGNRRVAACKHLKWQKVPCVLVDVDDKTAFELALTENIERKNLDPIEEAKAFEKYIVSYGWGGVTKLAALLGKSPAYVSSRLSLLRLPQHIQDLVQQGDVYPSTARELVQVKNSGALELVSSLRSSNDNKTSSREMREYAMMMRDDWLPNHSESSNHNYKILKKSVLVLRIARSRVSELVEQADDDIAKEYLKFECSSMHEIIDRAIKLLSRNEAFLDDEGV